MVKIRSKVSKFEVFIAIPINFMAFYFCYWGYPDSRVWGSDHAKFGFKSCITRLWEGSLPVILSSLQPTERLGMAEMIKRLDKLVEKEKF